MSVYPRDACPALDLFHKVFDQPQIQDLLLEKSDRKVCVSI